MAADDIQLTWATILLVRPLMALGVARVEEEDVEYQDVDNACYRLNVNGLLIAFPSPSKKRIVIEWSSSSTTAKPSCAVASEG